MARVYVHSLNSKCLALVDRMHLLASSIDLMISLGERSNFKLQFSTPYIRSGVILHLSQVTCPGSWANWQRVASADHSCKRRAFTPSGRNTSPSLSPFTAPESQMNAKKVAYTTHATRGRQNNLACGRRRRKHLLHQETLMGAPNSRSLCPTL